MQKDLKEIEDPFGKVEGLFMTSLTGNVLDVGCGYVVYYPYYVKGLIDGEITLVYCFDPNPALLLINKRIPLQIKNHFILEVNTLENIQLPNKKYDIIILRYSFNHITNKLEGIRKLYNCLKDGGTLYFIDGVSKENKEKRERAINRRANSPSPSCGDAAQRFVTNLKHHLSAYKPFLEKSEYNNFEKQTIDLYLNEEQEHLSKKDILSMFRQFGFKLIHELESDEFEGGTLQMVWCK